MGAPRRALGWFERHDTEIRELAWLGGVKSAPPAATEEESASPEAMPAPVAISPEREALDAAEAKLAELTAALQEANAGVTNARGELESVRAELAAAHGATERLTTRMRDQAEIELVKLAMSVAERVVGRELAVAPELIVSWAREAIAGSDLGGSFVIATSADLTAAVPDAAWGELEDALRMDPALPPGTCEVRDAGRSVAVSAEERLELVAAELANVSAPTKAA